jgi:hypothetical protein
MSAKNRKGVVPKHRAIKGRTLLRRGDEYRRLPDIPKWEKLTRGPLANESCAMWEALGFSFRRRKPAARAARGKRG